MNEPDNHSSSVGTALDRPDEAPVKAAPIRSGRAAGVSRMTARRWLFSVLAMAAAVAVVAGLKQPPPATPASGLSVPVRADNADNTVPVAAMAPVLVVSGGVTSWYQPTDIVTRQQDLPRGAHARQAVGLVGGATVIVATDSHGLPQAYYAQHGQLRRLGPAESEVRSADGRSVWLVNYGLLRKIDFAGRTVERRWRVPTGTTVIGANSRGIIVSGGQRGHTWLVSGRGTAPRMVAVGRALAVTEHRMLITRSGTFSLVNFHRQVVQRLPWPVALVPTGPGAVSPDGRNYALIARTAGRQRLVVGTLLGRNPPAPHVVPLDGGHVRVAPAPVWVGDTTVEAVRPDGRLVAYALGQPHGWLLSDGPTHIRAIGAA